MMHLYAYSALTSLLGKQSVKLSYEEKNEFTVFGYIREASREILNQNNSDSLARVPEEIYKLCVKFYHIAAGWDRKDLSNNEEDPSIFTFKYSEWGYKSYAWLLPEIDGTGKHHWKFELMKDPSTSCWFHISGSKGDLPDYGFQPGQDPPLKSAGGGIGRARTGGGHHYGEKAKKGDIIDMFVDMEGKYISFALNGNNLGKAWDIQPMPYTAQLMCNGDVIKFISYDNITN